VDEGVVKKHQTLQRSFTKLVDPSNLDRYNRSELELKGHKMAKILRDRVNDRLPRRRSGAIEHIADHLSEPRSSRTFTFGFRTGRSTTTMRWLQVMTALGLATAMTMGMAEAPAQAASISFSETIDSQPLSYSTDFELQKFDASLGTLTGITITLDAVGTGTLDVINLTDSELSFSDGTADLPIAVLAPGNVALSTTLVATPVSGVAAAGIEITPGFFFSKTSFTDVDTTLSASTAVDASAFGDYIGTDKATLTLVGGPISVTGTGPTGLFFGGSGVAGGTVTVTYTYTSVVVPEPRSATMLSLGILVAGGLGWNWQRKRRALASSLVG
jgi:hypothetical protein